MIVTRFPAPPDSDNQEDLVVYTPESEADLDELDRMYADGRLKPNARMADLRPALPLRRPDEGFGGH